MCGPYSNNRPTLYHYWVGTREPRKSQGRKKRVKRRRGSQQIDESDNQTSRM